MNYCECENPVVQTDERGDCRCIACGRPRRPATRADGKKFEQLAQRVAQIMEVASPTSR